MDTPTEERSLFNHVTCNISATVDEVMVPGALALDLIEQVGQLHQIFSFSNHSDFCPPGKFLNKT